MSLNEGLNVVTLVMCIITLSMATAALMPQIQEGLAILRDGVLWTLLVSIILAVGVVGWGRLHERLKLRQEGGQGEYFYESHSVEPLPEVAIEANRSFTANRSWASNLDAGYHQAGESWDSSQVR